MKKDRKDYILKSANVTGSVRNCYARDPGFDPR